MFLSTLCASSTLVGAVIGGPTSMLDAQPRAIWKGHCACAFVDIGLNDGSTLLTWWRRIDLKRLPTEQAQRLRACQAKPLESHCFFGFEANSRWSTQLKALQQRLQGRGAQVELVTDTALSTEDGERLFYVERDSKSPYYSTPQLWSLTLYRATGTAAVGGTATLRSTTTARSTMSP